MNAHAYGTKNCNKNVYQENDRFARELVPPYDNTFGHGPIQS